MSALHSWYKSLLDLLMALISQPCVYSLFFIIRPELRGCVWVGHIGLIASRRGSKAIQSEKKKGSNHVGEGEMGYKDNRRNI